MKTPEEAAREYASDNGFMHDEWRDIYNAFLAGYKVGEAQKWISVEEIRYEQPKGEKQGTQE